MRKPKRQKEEKQSKFKKAKSSMLLNKNIRMQNWFTTCGISIAFTGMEVANKGDRNRASYIE